MRLSTFSRLAIFVFCASCRTTTHAAATQEIATSTATPHFESVQPELFATARSFVNAWADFDGDDDLDLYVGFDGTRNRLYRNDAGAFTDVASNAGVDDLRPSRAAAWGDFDNDGDADLLAGFAPARGSSVLVLRRNDRGRFVDVTFAAGLARDSGAVRQLAWIDVDADADLDLFVAFRDRPNALFRNDVGRFLDIAPQVGVADKRKSVGATWFDYDEDGDLDLYVANMDGDANGLFRNDAGRFADVAAAAGLSWGGRLPNDASLGTVRPCAADVNNDGRLDVFAANYGTNGLFLNRGAGRFDDVSAQWGVAIDGRYDACAFADIDNDGWLDLYVNGTVTGGTSYRDYLMRNHGTRFNDITPPVLLALNADHGVQWADYDADGDADLALTGVRPDGMHSLFGNMLAPEIAARALRIRAVNASGMATLAGAEIRVLAAGTRRVLATRLIDAGSGYNAQSDMPVHVGLATWARIDIELSWPANGRRQIVRERNVDPRSWRGRTLTMRLPKP